MGPSVLIGGLIYLLTLLGPWSLLGVAVFVIFDIYQAGLGRTMVKYRKLAVEKTEERVSIGASLENLVSDHESLAGPHHERSPPMHASDQDERVGISFYR